MNRAKLAQNIYNARKAKGMTQKAMGDACGIAEPTIRRYESGCLIPKIETIEKIAHGIGIRTMTLLDGVIDD